MKCRILQQRSYTNIINLNTTTKKYRMDACEALIINMFISKVNAYIASIFQ